jgi:hypothetical protein
MLRRIFGYVRAQVTEKSRKLHDEELPNLHNTNAAVVTRLISLLHSVSKMKAHMVERVCASVFLSAFFNLRVAG